ncbi:GTP 3',8-cyclase MoaA [Motiliproteus sp. MSK22-1]|uniref:GTP 3',8-cyclase MoaA n=1 Tax=Motiliproteus sp. MSK22-1 TaxID=1897630 RepID=UPI0009771CCB|nr:GTP 3',8-cyclase MoaA [Motiliproteus sp. MSK22-1]OMH28420.1 cyclic pyranopterin phosphate synthase MoaA [Motiliproteus sp. MSK22-1]
MTAKTESAAPQLIDKFGRRVDYVRISVTDRCDFRCVYCMSEQMTFLPRDQVLSLEEIEQVAQAFVALGVTRIRLTGGEPLVRRGIDGLLHKLGALDGLDELVLTTNGSQLSRLSKEMKEAGVKRINISLDSLQADRFKRITRTGRLEQVLDGIDEALSVGFERIKLNAVIMKGRNEDEVIDLVAYAREKGLDISFIEEMPLGNIDHERIETYCSSDEVKDIIEQQFPLIAASDRTAGPSRYYRMADSESRIGFISPHSHNFCSECNRVRVTVEGRLLLCLGNEHSLDLMPILREYPGDQLRLQRAIIKAMDLKPEKHEFDLESEPQIVRFMNMTGG